MEHPTHPSSTSGPASCESGYRPTNPQAVSSVRPVASVESSQQMSYLNKVSFDAALFDAALCGGISLNGAAREASDIQSLCEDFDVLCIASSRPSQPPIHTSRPPNIVHCDASATPPSSKWFDDSPRQSVFSIGDEMASGIAWDTESQEWPDDSPVDSNFSDHEGNRISVFTFGRGGAMSPTLSSESHGSATMVPTETDGQSTRSSKRKSFNSMDEQLLMSPIDSFADMCWKSAVTPEPLKQKESKPIPELRLSKLFGETGQVYEEQHSKEYMQYSAATLPRMRFPGEGASRGVAEEVAPWMYVPKKAISVLALLDEVHRPPLPASVTTRDESLSQGVRRSHRRGQNSLGAIAGKCRKAMNYMSGQRDA